MKRGGEYNLKGTQELGERNGLKRERKKDAKIIKRQKWQKASQNKARDTETN